MTKWSYWKSNVWILIRKLSFLNVKTSFAGFLSGKYPQKALPPPVISGRWYSERYLVWIMNYNCNTVSTDRPFTLMRDRPRKKTSLGENLSETLTETFRARQASCQESWIGLYAWHLARLYGSLWGIIPYLHLVFCTVYLYLCATKKFVQRPVHSVISTLTKTDIKIPRIPKTFIVLR